ncbi:hypothetical protein C7B62_03695 [Pleurocapsa sp. CCALA 161]|uniref:hypothetical protein n=1 Tax=Pleurocapsa sp. CCALA 161 TaxID=2107688 RepID=UPI000D062B0D|nr:hypothetical protein [Pleurocapsa sp. CCALA 161]PSB11999.1 hypothetical protein C7B62_03695 [Pleurocapsa sp. CCALA 161]
MNTNSLNPIVIKGFFGFCLGLISCVSQPVRAESVKENRTLEDRFDQATSAQSLLTSPSSEQIKSIIAQRQLDLSQFCQSYPHNSKCLGVNPAQEPRNLENASRVAPTPQAEVNTVQKKSGWAIVPEISTLGIGGHVVKRVTPNLNARLGINNFGRDINVNETEYEYKGNLNLFNVSTLVDYQPFKKVGLRLSGGLVFGNNNIQGTADVSERVANELGTVEIGGQDIDIRNLNIENLASIDTDIEINEGVSPYLGIGGGNAVKPGKGLGFWWDLGVVFSGSPHAEVTSNFSTDIPTELREEVVAAADEALKDEEKDLNEALDIMGIYPVLSFGLSYQF